VRPVVFLDIDGVLVTSRSIGTWDSKYKCNRFDQECVKNLNLITDKTRAEIVVSSSWRVGNWPQLVEFLQVEGVTGLVRDRTPLRSMEPRGSEIGCWLHEEGFTGPFVILDDDTDMADLSPRLLRTSMEDGLTQAIAQRAIKMLTE